MVPRNAAITLHSLYPTMLRRQGAHASRKTPETNMPRAQDLNWPTNFSSRYQPTGRLLGIGMQGIVLEVVDKQSEQRFAVKKLRKDSTADSRTRVLGRLAAEAEALERLQHASGVVQLVDKFEDAVFAYLVLEIMEGGSLADALKVRTRTSVHLCLPALDHRATGAAATLGRGSGCVRCCTVPDRAGCHARAGHRTRRRGATQLDAESALGRTRAALRRRRCCTCVQPLPFPPHVCAPLVARSTTRLPQAEGDVLLKVGDFGCSPTGSEEEAPSDEELWGDWDPPLRGAQPCGALHYTAPEALTGVRFATCNDVPAAMRARSNAMLICAGGWSTSRRVWSGGATVGAGDPARGGGY